MEVLALYLLKVHIGISLMYGVYYLTVRKELFFKLNRFILLVILLLSFTLPLLPGFSFDLPISDGSTALRSMLVHEPVTDPIVGKEVGKFDDEIELKRLYGIITTLVAFYLCGVAFHLSRFFSQIANVMNLVRSSSKASYQEAEYLDPGENVPAFSFFNSIVINSEQFGDTQLRHVIAHEKAHTRQMHSIDIMLSEIASVILWGNPLIRSLKHTVKMNLEFLADNEVLNQGFDKKAYQWAIIRPYLQNISFPLTNQYNSKPKQRIERMNATPGSLFNLCKYLLIIPVIVFLYIGVAPYHANALDRIDAMKRIDDHDYRDFLGYYEFERDKGSYIRIMMKDQAIVMNTLWNNKKIYFQKHSKNGFINPEAYIQLAFPRNYEGAVTGLVAFGDDRWRKVQKYIPVKKNSGEGTVISRTSSGGMQVLVYAIEPWANVRHYSLKDAVSSP